MLAGATLGSRSAFMISRASSSDNLGFVGIVVAALLALSEEMYSIENRTPKTRMTIIITVLECQLTQFIHLQGYF
jgi:hypothetical protein